MVGRKIPLVEAITNGIGRVQIDDTFWRVEGEDLDKDTLISIIDSDGATLKVERTNIS